MSGDNGSEGDVDYSYGDEERPVSEVDKVDLSDFICDLYEDLKVDVDDTESIISICNVDTLDEISDPTEQKIVEHYDSDELQNLWENLEIFRPQEPWPKDVKLFQPYEVEQILLPDNANCLAVQAFLRMCNLEFQVEPRANAEAMSPSGKVPFIKAGAFIIAEMESIVQFVNGKGITLTEKLEPESKADLRAYMSLIHSVLEMAELYICWCDKETYNEVTSKRHGSIYPWPLNHIQNRAKRSAVIKKLKALEWYQKPLSEVFEEVENCCQSLTERLEDKEYFFGDRPTELDALVFGHLFTILTTPLPNSHIANTVRNYPSLINLVQRIEKEYFKRETQH